MYERKGLFENLGIDGRRILKRIMNKHSAIMEAEFVCLGLMTVEELL
jgi:hypothetical protein